MTVGSGGCSRSGRIGKITIIQTAESLQAIPNLEGSEGTDISEVSPAITEVTGVKTIINIDGVKKAMMLTGPEPTSTLSHKRDFTLTSNYNTLIANSLNPGDTYNVIIYTKNYYSLSSTLYAVSYTTTITVDLEGTLNLILPNGTILNIHGSGASASVALKPRVEYYPTS